MTALQNKEGLIHVRYEMRRLDECYRRWRALRPAYRSQSAVNDLIELTLLHARAILDFFEYGRGHKKIRNRPAFDDDIVSEDYGWPAMAIPIDQKIKTRINKEIAHLSYFRCGLTRTEKRWRPEQFIPVLLDQCAKFLAHVK
jgi:hypothetical protein